jgi:hypothetical protein
VDPLTPTPPRPEFIEPPKNTPIDQLDFTRRTRPIMHQLAVKDTDELYAVEKRTINKLCGQWPYGAWDEICRILEGLGYDVSGRYHDWCIGHTG